MLLSKLHWHLRFIPGNGYYNNNDNSFIFNLEYIVDAGSFGTYSAILQLPIPTAPARDRQEEDITPKAASELKATLQPNKQMTKPPTCSCNR